MKHIYFIIVILILNGCVLSDFPKYASEPEILSQFKLNDKIGFKNKHGNVVIIALYDDAGDFAWGLAPVNIGAQREFPGVKTGGKWGYINTKGALVVPFTLDHAREFSNGLAQVSDQDGVKFIDPQDNTVIKLGNVTAGDFSEGIAPVYKDRSLEQKDWQTSYIDKTGSVVFTIDGWAKEFHEGLAVLTVKTGTDPENKRFGFINREGEIAISPTFAEALYFNEGLAPVRTEKTTVYGMGDLWGYIDKAGQYVIKPQFNEARHFEKGLAKVHVGGTLHVVDDAPPFWEGGEWQVINKKGKILKQSKE